MTLTRESLRLLEQEALPRVVGGIVSDNTHCTQCTCHTCFC